MEKHPLVNRETEEARQNMLFENIRKNMEKNMDEEQVANLKALGEKFHESFDITKGTTTDLTTINLEEALAYVVESLKSGIHPGYLDENERAMLEAGYGEEWYKKWGYTKDDLESQ